MTSVPDISIIGPGKVGTALGILAQRAGLHVAAVGGGRRCSAQEAARAIGNSVRALPATEAATAGKLVLLTVPDDAIEAVCNQLVREHALSPGAVVAHCCGSLSSQILAPARNAGCSVGSMHPMQTFPTAQAGVERMAGTFCFIEGDALAVEVLEALARAISAKPVRTTAEGKSLYHAAGCMASNYLATLLDAASGLLAFSLPESSGMDRAQSLAALEPLVRATAENVLTMGPAKALTGPIARGDVGTVQRHLQAMEQCTPELLAAYRALARLTVELAVRKGTLNETTAAAMYRLLK